jgi:hypothetical protein
MKVLNLHLSNHYLAIKVSLNPKMLINEQIFGRKDEMSREKSTKFYLTTTNALCRR